MSQPAVKRTIDLLEQLLQNPDGLSAQELQERTQISRSTMFADLRVLKELSYVEQADARSRYFPGPRLVAWQRRNPVGTLDLTAAFQAEASALELEETLALILPAADNLLILAQQEAPRRVRSSFPVGHTISTDSCAAGLLFEPTGSAAVRALGYHLQETGDTLELALPICPDGTHPEAALLLSAPRFRTSPTQITTYLESLREAAARLSYRLGAQVYIPFGRPSPPTIEPAQSMEPREIREFLRGPWAARLACLSPDGSPHVVPVWHEWDGQNFFVVAWQGSKWGEYLKTNPRVSLTVDEPWPPLRRVSVQGYAQILENSQANIQLPQLSERLSRRYLGKALHPTQEQRQGSLFRIQPDKIRGWRGLHGEPWT